MTITSINTDLKNWFFENLFYHNLYTFRYYFRSYFTLEVLGSFLLNPCVFQLI